MHKSTFGTTHTSGIILSKTSFLNGPYNTLLPAWTS